MHKTKGKIILVSQIGKDFASAQVVPAKHFQMLFKLFHIISQLAANLNFSCQLAFIWFVRK